MSSLPTPSLSSLSHPSISFLSTTTMSRWFTITRLYVCILKSHMISAQLFVTIRGMGGTLHTLLLHSMGAYADSIIHPIVQSAPWICGSSQTLCSCFQFNLMMSWLEHMWCISVQPFHFIGKIFWYRSLSHIGGGQCHAGAHPPMLLLDLIP